MIESDARPQAPAPRRRRLRRTVLGLLVIAVLALGGTGAYAAWAMGGTANGDPVKVVVPGGAGAAEIATILHDAGVVRSAFVFRLIVRLRGQAGELRPGTYALREGLGVSDAIEALREGVKPKTFRFTIPEGKTVIEIARIVERATTVTADGFLRAARSGRHRVAIMPKGLRNLEGLLFPKTYEVRADATADQIVELLLAQFEKETAGLGLARAGRFGLAPYEAVIVASLIEREARLAREQRLVSSVIHNRLARPMRLQIDATVQYALLLQTGRYKFPLTFDDYDLASPYNTYRIDGLPPTPIASPGIGALRAALGPARTRYFYYVQVGGEGAHCFARTEDEFNRCKARG